ncbi:MULTISPECIES: NUDIX hydrolase [unclassified Ensifer]|uniref:NUDIX hydrolase n=1 Tax=unclassified Ensifer TaxID=2633371 RepID=UPI000DD6B31F|nr:MULTISPECIES: NUDIX hydrolase [unclassified Ensifer]MBD9494703.1 NUDIX hydrolase [Ensifer sp. ENS01]MBD9518734.1 NUDIX hydrolase [Ensifer sp. ENS02]
MSALESNTDAWPDEGVIIPIDAVDVRVTGAAHPFHREEVERAQENWQREIAANPHLFDGRMVLLRALRIADGRLRGEGHVVPYSTFLWWRKTRAKSAFHLFAMPAILSSDGALILVRMGGHTANPGRVYSPSGSLEPEDIVDGGCDIDGNIRREAMEETGIDLSLATVEPGYHLLHMGRAVTLIRVYRYPETAAALVARVAEHIAADPEPEIDEAIAVFGPDPVAHNYPPFIPPILDWLFRREKPL